MAEVTGASLNPIYERLRNAPTYHPLEADTFADWSMEAGDIVTISRDGKSYASPVHTSTVTWKKGQQVTVSSGGNEKREPVSKLSQRKYNAGSSGLRNSSHMRSYVDKGTEQMHLYVDDKYTQMRSGLLLTGSEAHLYVDNKYAQMTAGLKLTSSSAHLYVDNKYAQMTAGLKLTSSSAHLYVDNKYAQMTAGLKLTSSEAHLYVDNKYSQMSAGLKLTESSARLYAKSADNAAEIVARINESTGESEIQLSSDKVYIGNQKSTTVINGKLNTSDFTASTITAKLVGANVASLSNVGSLEAHITSIYGSNIYFTAHDPSTGRDVTTSLKTGLSAVRISGPSSNKYTLQYKRFSDTEWQDAESFSRAVALSGGWSGGVYRVSATEGTISGAAPSTTLFDLGLGSATKGTGSTVSATYDIGYASIVSGQQVRGGSTGKTGTLSLGVSGLLQEKSVSENGDVTPDSDYIGLSKVTVSGGHWSSHSNGAYDLTFIAAPDKTTRSGTQMYYYYNGTLTSAGTGFWYRRNSYMDTRYVYT